MELRFKMKKYGGIEWGLGEVLLDIIFTLFFGWGKVDKESSYENG